MARYGALVFQDTDSDVAIMFPDLPGCIAVGSDLDEALRLAEEALGFHLEGLSDLGLTLPSPSSLKVLTEKALAAGSIALIVTARQPKAPAIRVNITLDKNLLADIDEAATTAGTTRSGYLAEAARRLMQR